MAGRTTVTVNLRGLTKFREALKADLRLSGNSPIRHALDQWKTLLARFLTHRWYTFSQGGGNWKALKPATLTRKIKKGLLPFILRATDEMFQAFAPAMSGKPSRVAEDIPLGVRVGFGGDMSYPHSTAHVQMSKLAMWHQTGAGNLPARKIIVPPDTETKKQMRDVMQEAMVKTARGEAA